MNESLHVNEAKLKVGDKIKGSDGITKDKTGEVMSIKNDMAQVDFGGGNKYGIALSRIDNGEFKIVNEAKDQTITVIVHGGKKLQYSKADIQEFIDDFSASLGSDNLPKWLYTSNIYGLKYNKKKVLSMLQKMKDYEGSAIVVNVDGASNQHAIVFESVNEPKIDSESEFREYAKELLKNAHGDEYDESIASKMIDDLITKYGDDGEWGDAVGVLQNSLD